MTTLTDRAIKKTERLVCPDCGFDTTVAYRKSWDSWLCPGCGKWQPKASVKPDKLLGDAR